MKIRKIGLLIFILAIGFISCKKDDDDGTTVVIEENDRTEQQVIDNDSIVQYLETHYYNSSTFVESTTVNVKDLVFTELAEGETVPDGSTLLIDAVETKTTEYLDTNYEYYILRLNQGGGSNSPRFSDNVYAVYEGFTLDNDVFESNLELISNNSLLSVIFGWRLVFPEFNVATSFVENSDGTVTYENYGAGAMFLPSGLGYFSSFTVGTQYAPLVFKFNLYGMQEIDHDLDGVPSYLEDLNGDGEFTVNFDDLDDTTDDDTDGDGFSDFQDSDDDGDGILTINEDIDEDGDPTNDDTNGNGIPNYLDTEDIISNLDN